MTNAGQSVWWNDGPSVMEAYCCSELLKVIELGERFLASEDLPKNDSKTVNKKKRERWWGV